MFNKEESNIFGNIEIKNASFYRKEHNISITPSFALMYNPYIENKHMEEQMDYEEKKTSYINRKNELNIKKQYNPIIVDLYNNGILVIDNDEILLKDLFIVYKEDKKFNLLNIKENNNLEYNYAIRFIDTTAFINLINLDDSIVKDNKIIINSKDILEKLITNWDGYIHDKVKETDAIMKKNIVGVDNNE